MTVLTDILRATAWNETADAFAAVDVAQLQIVDVNDACAELFGRDRDELVSAALATILPPAVMRELKDGVRAPAALPLTLSAFILRPGHDGIAVEIRSLTGAPCVGLALLRFAPVREVEAQDQLKRLSWAAQAYARSVAALSQTDDIPSVARAMCEAIANDTYVVAWIGLKDDNPEKSVSLIARAGKASGYADTLTLSWDEASPDGQGPSGIAFRTGRTQVMRDWARDLRFARWRESAERYGIRSSVTVPFSDGEKVIGGFAVYASVLDAFGPKEIELFSHLGSVLGRDIQAIESRARLRRLEAEDRRKSERQALLASIVENSHDFIGISSREGTMRYLNKSALDMVGLERLDGRTAYEDFFTPAARQAFLSEAVPALQRQGRVKVVSEFRHFGDGHTIPVEIEAFVVRGPDGAPIGLAGITRDLTDKLREERYKADLQTQLIQAQKMEALGRLTGGIAHDFNNFLAVVLGYADILDVMEDLPPLARRAVQSIRESGTRSTDLVRQLMGFSRQQMIQPRPLNLNQLLSSLQSMLTRIAGEDVELAIIEDGRLWDTFLDPSQVDQVLLNLVANARDAMPDGGAISIETANERVDETYVLQNPDARAGDYVRLTVSDTGTGMDAATVARVFEPFFTTKDEGRGTGLGLATVYGIVRQNAGFIHVYSELGHGTTFKLYFPRHAAQTDSAVEIAGAPEVPLPAGAKRQTVLLVEDDDLVREMTAQLLRRLGYEPLVATGAEQALALCSDAATTIDLMVCDLVMPGMNGTELFARAAELRPSLKVLYMSGYTSDVVVRRGMLKPDVHFLQKPFTAAALERKLRAMLG